MAITNPNIIPRPIVSSTGRLTAAAQIELSDTSSVENGISLIRQSGLVWLQDTKVGVDPADNSFTFDNAAIASVTNLYLDKNGENCRIDEYLTQFSTGSFVWIQDLADPSFNVLFTTSGAVADTGGATGYFTIPVTFRRSVGTYAPTADRRYSFHFLAITGSGGGGGSGPTDEEVRDLVANFVQSGTGVTVTHDDPGDTLTISVPNNFLAELTEVDTNTFTDRVDAPADAAFVRFWLRSDLVTPTNLNDPGVGLVISEANGDLSSTGSTFSQSTNDNNVYVYFTLPDAFVDPLDLTTLYLVIKDIDGNIVDTVQVDGNFILQADIDGGAAGRPYRSTSGLNGGSFLHYFNNQTLELFIVTVNQAFSIPLANADNVNLTRGIKNLPESALAGDVQAKLNYNHGIPDDDQFKLDQFVEVSTTSASAALTGSDTIYYKQGTFSNAVGDYFTTDFDTGLPPSFDQTTTWLVAIPHNHNITSLEGIESGTGTATLLKDDVLITGATGTFNLYTCVVPVTASATNFFLFVGTRTTITEIDPSNLIKIDRNNVQADFLTHIENSNGSTSETARIDALENKVSTLYPLAPDVDALTSWGDIYEPERAVGEVVLTQGYDLIADYRGPSTRFESTGVVYSDAGTNVVTYTGLTESLQRGFGFHVNAPADQILLWLVDGSDRIPFIDMTVGGTYRVNNYTQATTMGQSTTQTTELALVSPDTGIIAVGGSNARFIIPDYPIGATETSRSASVGFDVLVNGVDTSGEHFETFDIPETQLVQDRIQRTFTIFLGPLHGNRNVAVTIDYRFTVAAEYRLIFTLQNAPSDVTIRVRDAFETRTFTPAATVVRTDNFETLQDAGGDYTFTGENELLIVFAPVPQGGTMEGVPVAVDSTGAIDELNDSVVPVPVHGFEDVEIPDTTALANFEFRTFRANHYLRHSDISTLLRDRTLQWAYGLARLRSTATIHAVTEAIDLATGSTVNGTILDAGRTTQDSQAFTAAASVVVTLPASTSLSDFIIMEVTWHTGVGTATDNDNRNYTEMGFVPAIINATDAELILGGRGRGADNFGIEVTTTGVTGATTSLTLDIINLNDVGGATLPAGSLITAVRFY